MMQESPVKAWENAIIAEVKSCAAKLRISGFIEQDIRDYGDIGAQQFIRNVFLRLKGVRTSPEMAQYAEKYVNSIGNLYVMRNAYEVRLDYRSFIKYTDYYKDHPIDMPFEDVNFVFYIKDKGYASWFVQSTGIFEKFKHNDKLYKVFKFKFAAVIDGKAAITGEAGYIKEFHPRLFIHCNQLDKDCEHENIKNYKYIAEDNSLLDFDECLKTPNTAHRCHMANDTETLAESMFRSLSMISRVCELYNNRHKRKAPVSTFAQSGTNGELNSKTREQTPEDSPRFVIINSKTGETTGYFRGRFQGSKHSKHESPREHQRSGFKRKLKDGRIVDVKPTVVNRGKRPKTMYEFK